MLHTVFRCIIDIKIVTSDTRKANVCSFLSHSQIAVEKAIHLVTFSYLLLNVFNTLNGLSSEKRWQIVTDLKKFLLGIALKGAWKDLLQKYLITEAQQNKL